MNKKLGKEDKEAMARATGLAGLFGGYWHSKCTEGKKSQIELRHFAVIPPQN